MKRLLVWVILIVFILLLRNILSTNVEIEKGEISSSPLTQIKNTSSSEAKTSQRNYFNGYVCKEDCSGHEAGYEWAEEHDIDNLEDCGGNSDSFIEGCQSYVEENYPEEYDEDVY